MSGGQDPAQWPEHYEDEAHWQGELRWWQEQLMSEGGEG